VTRATTPQASYHRGRLTKCFRAPSRRRPSTLRRFRTVGPTGMARRSLSPPSSSPHPGTHRTQTIWRSTRKEALTADLEELSAHQGLRRALPTPRNGSRGGSPQNVCPFTWHWNCCRRKRIRRTKQRRHTRKHVRRQRKSWVRRRNGFSLAPNLPTNLWQQASAEPSLTGQSLRGKVRGSRLAADAGPQAKPQHTARPPSSRGL
jgi:hypothetical protein